MEEVLRRWMKEHLKAYDVDEDTLSDYLAPLVCDDADDIDSRIEVADSILSASTEEDISSFLKDLRLLLENPPNTANTSEEIREVEVDHSMRDKINEERIKASMVQKERKTINVKEMKQREALMNEYGFDVMETTAEGDLILREKKKDSFDMEGVNENALRVKMAEKMKREVMKSVHDSEVRRNKELEAKRKQEKEKKKTVKQERKGRGGYM